MCANRFYRSENHIIYRQSKVDALFMYFLFICIIVLTIETIFDRSSPNAKKSAKERAFEAQL